MRVFFAALPLVLMSVSCSETETLRVRQFHLRDNKVANGNEFIRGEMGKRLYGAVTLEEREARRGQYYNISWHDLSGARAVKVVFEYQQAVSGADVKRIVKTLPASREGMVEIRMIGDSYQKGGRIVAWRVTLFDGGESVAQKQSYLWD
ncbi:hypothetical protein V2O64_21250 [Verrucomicrobiaceae bacterium 227]